jgi:flagellar hook-associated protein 1 FlgK
MTGGSLGGLLRFRDEILDDAQNALGRVAVGLASFFNAEHRSGMDLDGDLGDDFFGLAAPQALGSTNNAAGSSVAIAIDDAALLTTHEYRLDRSAGSWSMIDLDTGAAVALSGTGAPGDPLVAAPPGLGFSVLVNAAVDGDSFLLRPTRKGASDMDVLIANGRDIAAAEPLRTGTAANNSGTGSISPGALSDLVGSPSLPVTPAVAVEYQAGNQLVQADGSAIGPSDGFVPGQTYRIEIPSLGTFEFTMTGAPGVGDSFAIEDNAGGVGDNRNARRLADLQTANLMIGGTASISNTYGALIADVGTRTQQAGSNAGVQENLLAQAESAKSEVAGVNLDEEAADLVRFQQAYQAAAQVISIANTLFDSLLGAVRR